MKVQTNVKAGGRSIQHNEKQAKNLIVKTGVKAGGQGWQHNEKLTRE